MHIAIYGINPAEFLEHAGNFIVLKITEVQAGMLGTTKYAWVLEILLQIFG